MSMVEVSKETGIPYEILRHRFEKWDMELETSVAGEKELRPLVNTFTYHIYGREMTLLEVVETFGITIKSFISRINHGYSPEDAAIMPVFRNTDWCRKNNYYKGRKKK